MLTSSIGVKRRGEVCTAGWVAETKRTQNLRGNRENGKDQDWGARVKGRDGVGVGSRSRALPSSRFTVLDHALVLDRPLPFPSSNKASVMLHAEHKARTVCSGTAGRGPDFLLRATALSPLAISSAPPSTISTMRSVSKATPVPASASKYPRPSPPSFFYPVPIVPQQNHDLAPRNMTPNTHVLRHTAEFDLPDIPTACYILLYACIALGALWTLVAYCVNFPPGLLASTAEKGSEKRKRKQRGRDVGKRGWWEKCKNVLYFRNATSGGPKKKKPIDKPSKYAHVPTSDESSSVGTEMGEGEGGLATGTSASASTPWFRAQQDAQDIELKQRQPQLHALCTRIPSSGPVSPIVHRERQSRASSVSLPLHATPLSPLNPYLPPLLRRRNSAEFQREHERFFSQGQRGSPGAVTFSSPEDLEAQTPTRVTFGDGERGDNKDNRMNRKNGTHKRNVSWLETVDGAMNWGVERMVKWTLEGGADEQDEGALLPVANGG